MAWKDIIVQVRNSRHGVGKDRIVAGTVIVCARINRKIFSEVCGRIPEPGGWSARIARVDCRVSQIKIRMHRLEIVVNSPTIGIAERSLESKLIAARTCRCVGALLFGGRRWWISYQRSAMMVGSKIERGIEMVEIEARAVGSVGDRQ